MSHNVVHFAIHADDVSRARKFYESVFGWRFEPWGPPDFYLIHTGGEDEPRGIHGALQKRREPLSGAGMRGFECTISVRDIAGVRSAVEAAGGTIVFKEITIPTVGTMFQFVDTEGNVVGAMRYDDPRMG